METPLLSSWRWPLVLNTKRRRAMALFALTEVVLLSATPFLALAGIHTLMRNTAGVFVTQPEATEPGWRARVDPTIVDLVIETANDRIVGVALTAHEAGVTGGAVALISPEAQLDPKLAQIESRASVGSLPPDELTRAISHTFRLDINSTITVDRSQAIDKGVGDELFDEADREVLWQARLEADALASDHPLTPLMSAFENGMVDIFTVSTDGSLDLGVEVADAAVRRGVDFPSGAVPEQRIRIRLVDLTGQSDLPTIAAELGSDGYEVTEIGNAAAFIDKPSEIRVPSQWIGPDTADLIELADVAVTVEEVDEPQSVIVIAVGSDWPAPN